MKPNQIQAMNLRLTELIKATVGVEPHRVQPNFYVGKTHKVVNVTFRRSEGDTRSFAQVAVDVERAFTEGTSIRSMSFSESFHDFTVSLELDLTFWLSPVVTHQPTLFGAEAQP